MEEDAEPNEHLPGDDFTYSHDATIAFQELLSNIDSHTKELPNVLSTKHYAALTQLPLTYPWARLVLDLKELLISFDRHLITCLIVNQVQGNDTSHPDNVLLWRSFHARPIFYMKNDPVLGVVKTELFVRLVHSKDYTSAAIGLCISSACKVLL